MGETDKTLTLRPLGIGELFDRAFTLLVRYYNPFVFIAIVGVLPAVFFRYLSAAFALPSLTYADELVGGISVAVAVMATAVVVSHIYERREIDVLCAFKTGFWNIPGAVAADVTMILVFLAPPAIAVGILSAIFRIHGVIAMGSLVLLTLPIVAVGMFACVLSQDTLAVESLGTIDSIRRTFSRVFGSAGRGRPLLMAVVWGLVYIGGWYAAAFCQKFLYSTLHSLVLGEAAWSLVMIATLSLSSVLAAVFYFDIRIRREGYDLDVSLDTMEAATA